MHGLHQYSLPQVRRSSSTSNQIKEVRLHVLLQILFERGRGGSGTMVFRRKFVFFSIYMYI